MKLADWILECTIGALVVVAMTLFGLNFPMTLFALLGKLT